MKTKFDFIRKSKFFMIVSALIIFMGIASIIYNRGFKLGIDFAGGTAFNMYFPPDKNVDVVKIKEAMQKYGITGEVTSIRNIGTDKRGSYYITINEENQVTYKNQKVMPSDIFLYEIYSRHSFLSIEPVFDNSNAIQMNVKNNALSIEKLIEILAPTAEESRRMSEQERSSSAVPAQTATTAPAAAGQPAQPRTQAQAPAAEYTLPENADKDSVKSFASRLVSGRIFKLKDGSGFKIQIDIPAGTSASDKAGLYTKFRNLLFEKLVQNDVTKIKIEGRQFIGPKIGSYFIRISIQVVILVSAIILIYVAVRFRFKFGLAAVIALLHDTIISIGLVSLLKIEMDITVVAAILTILGYSINDTIVVFDRIRENTEKISTNKDEYVMIVNRSINQSLTRTIITSLTTLLVVVVLLIWGGESLYNFYLILFFGIIIGTYSSIFIASPVLVIWEHFVEKREKKSKKNKKVTA